MRQKQKSVPWSDFLGFATQMSAGCWAALCLEAPSSWSRVTAACPGGCFPHAGLHGVVLK